MTDVYMLRKCVMCGARAAKPRVGALGEQTGGMWCTQCGHVWTPVKAAPVNLLNVGPVFDLSAPPTAVTVPKAPTILDQLRSSVGDDLDTLACNWLGRIRDHNPDGTFENDDQFRARLLRELGAK